MRDTIDLLHEYDPHPQPLSQNGRGEPELALLPWWEKGKAFGYKKGMRGLGLMQEV
jgi:hypothetical protein